MKTLSIEKFFSPSSELTKKITERMREQSLADLQHSLGSVGGLETDNSDGTAVQYPWTDLLEAGNEGYLTSPEELAADQRWLSEILYGYLARLAYSQILPENQSYDAAETISSGMMSRLGLNESTDLELLQQLAHEFQQWLSECSGMTFVAGWGTVWADPVNKGRFGVERFTGVVEDEDGLAVAAKGRAATAASHELTSKALSAGVGSRALARSGNWLANLFSLDKKATK